MRNILRIHSYYCSWVKFLNEILSHCSYFTYQQSSCFWKIHFVDGSPLPRFCCVRRWSYYSCVIFDTYSLPTLQCNMIMISTIDNHENFLREWKILLNIVWRKLKGLAQGIDYVSSYSDYKDWIKLHDDEILSILEGGQRVLWQFV